MKASHLAGTWGKKKVAIIINFLHLTDQPLQFLTYHLQMVTELIVTKKCKVAIIFNFLHLTDKPL